MASAKLDCSLNCIHGENWTVKSISIWPLHPRKIYREYRMSSQLARKVLRCVFLAGQLFAAASYAAAPDAENALDYQLPAPELQAIVDAPRAPQVYVAPDGHAVALVGRAALPSISIVAEPQARLAGIRFNPQLRLETRFDFGNSLRVLDVGTGMTRDVEGLPAALRVVAVAWSPNSRRLAVSLVDGGAIRLWLVDAATRKAHLATRAPLNAITDDGLRLRPEHEAAAPQSSAVPTGPNVQFADGHHGASQLATFEDLLKTPFDEALLDYYLSAQVGVLHMNGKLVRVGPVERILSISGAPDRQHMLVTRLLHPYSRIVPLPQFPTEVEVWSRSGHALETVAKTPLIEVLAPGPDAVNPGPREFTWRADRPSTLWWVEAQDGGDPRKAVEVRDIVYNEEIPSQGRRDVIAKLPRRFASVYWARDDLALVVDWTWKTRDKEIWRINPGKPENKLDLMWAWKSEDRYSDPGRPLTRIAPNGASVLRMHGNSVLLVGDGATPEGERPFLNRLEFDSHAVTTVWRSAAPYYEYPIEPLNDEGTPLITRRESGNDPPNLVLHTKPNDSGVALTHFPNPTPQLAGVTKQVLRYKRPDAVEMTANLYLPPGYDAKRDGPLPTLLWAYPREFKSAMAASEVQGSPHKFNAIGFWGPLPFLARGFAVLDDPTMPIVGEGSAEPNDTYVAQLVADAQAAIDEVVRLGVGDRNRMAIGGHSYGAFMTANLLTHSRLFKAGIARSGAYNRTLTPFGFQAEDRNFWDAREIYIAMSPFMHAEEIKDPILLIHGEMDNNTGTFPIQSERMYQAIKGLGGTVRLVMLPNESHGYRARESILHMLWEEDLWLTRYVKNATSDQTH
jgi:dipeptidyl aminopeptidase/acylaminoacyl peptidase